MENKIIEKLSDIIKKHKRSAEIDLEIKKKELNKLCLLADKDHSLKSTERNQCDAIEHIKGEIDAYIDVLCTIEMITNYKEK